MKINKWIKYIGSIVILLTIYYFIFFYSYSKAPYPTKYCVKYQKLLYEVATKYIYDYKINSNYEINLNQLLNSNYIDSIPVCPANGKYKIICKLVNSKIIPFIKCDVHVPLNENE